MRKMKKIITLAMTLVMMMAMSMTAFAEPAADATNSGAKLTITNLSDEESVTIDIYEVAKAGTNGWSYATWVNSAWVDETKNPVDIKWSELDKYARENTLPPAKPQVVTAKDQNGKYPETVEFTGLTGAAYLVVATATEGGSEYAPMGQVTYQYINGVYSPKDNTIVAKTSNVPVHKEIVNKDVDQFVKVGQDVSFDINTVIPNVDEFVIYDQPKNLENLSLVKVTLGGKEQSGITKEDKVDEDGNAFIAIDLKSLLSKANVGKKVVITVKGTVGSDVTLTDAYQNTAWSNLITPDKGSTVTGFTGDITLTKYDASKVNKLAGAKFNVVTKNEDGTVKDTLLFVETNTPGVYKLAKSTEQGTDEVTVDANGVVKVIGLDEGKYYFHETVAPTGYSLNPTDSSATITKDEKNVSTETYMTDTTLVSLPFTGGMGTTIFTILGVAIMAMAAALFFATKKSR